MASPSDTIIVDGSTDFSGGVDSIKVTTIADQTNPNGLARNQLAWANNVTVRDGGITTRPAVKRIGTIKEPGGFYQGGYTYEPDGQNPYLVISVGGHWIQVLPDAPGSAVDLSAAFGLFNPASPEQAFFVQAEMFLVGQAGDYTGAPTDTLPLFWDNVTLRRSKGITNPVVAPGTPGVNEIPAATCMDYYEGRLWYAQNRQYSAGDIVKGASGTIAYAFRDAVLNVTENPLVLGSDGFTVPTNAGSIRALKHSANLNSTLGQGQLFIFTRKSIYSLSVPISRHDWIAADNQHQPLQTVVQLVNGAVGDRCIPAVNGDLFYQSLEPGIRSLMVSVREFDQWGNTQVGANVERILQFNDRSLLHFASGIEFDNRMFQTALPTRKARGVVHPAWTTLDFTPLSTFESEAPPVWEGMGQGIDVLQFFTGDFGGLQRAFAVVLESDQSIALWEITKDEKFDTLDNRITSYIEFPAFNAGDSKQLKKLVGADLWVDRLYGQVVFNMEFRPDGDPCWSPWRRWEVCTSRSTCEDVHNPICYPVTPHLESYRSTMTLGKPPEKCQSNGVRPNIIAYQHQPKLTIHGFCRIRGIFLYWEPVQRALYNNPVC